MKLYRLATMDSVILIETAEDIRSGEKYLGRLYVFRVETDSSVLHAMNQEPFVPPGGSELSPADIYRAVISSGIRLAPAGDHLESFRALVKSYREVQDDSQNVDIDMVTIGEPDDLPLDVLPVLSEAVDEFSKMASGWTQDQVYDDGENIYDIGILKGLLEHNDKRRLKVSDYVDQLANPDVWAYEGKPLSPLDVLGRPTASVAHVEHMQRLRTADMSNPIIIRVKNNEVVDGYHRLSRAFLEKRDRIDGVFAQEEQMNQALFRPSPNK